MKISEGYAQRRIGGFNFIFFALFILVVLILLNKNSRSEDNRIEKSYNQELSE